MNTSTFTNDGLLFALALDGNGGAQSIDWDQLQEYWENEDILWVHLDYSNPRVQEWIQEHSSLDEHLCAALVSGETRPRCFVLQEGMQVNMRGINHNSGEDVEDMVSLRMWLEEKRIITLRQRRLLATEDIRERLQQGNGPKTAGNVLAMLAQALVNRASGTIQKIEDQMDQLEAESMDGEPKALRTALADIRRLSIQIRRFLAPQRDATTQIILQELPWISPGDRSMLREVGDRLTRYVEELDAIRERAAVTQEELNARLNERTNRIVYILSVITAIFLPLGFLTGLLGINVGGMPGTENGEAFWYVCGGMILISLLEIVIIWRMRLLA